MRSTSSELRSPEFSKSYLHPVASQANSIIPVGLGTSFLYPERLDAHLEIDIPRSTLYCFQYHNGLPPTARIARFPGAGWANDGARDRLGIVQQVAKICSLTVVFCGLSRTSEGEPT